MPLFTNVLEKEFCELRLNGVLRSLPSRWQRCFLATWHTQKMCQVDIPICPIR